MFTSAMVHELRNPLNAVLGSLEIIQTNISALPQQHVQYIFNAQDSGEILHNMISNLLDGQKLGQNKFELNIEPIEIRLLVWKIVSTNKESALRKGIALKMINEPQIPKYLMIDKARFTQILVNIISNAIKFTEEGAVIIRIC